MSSNNYRSNMPAAPYPPMMAFPSSSSSQTNAPRTSTSPLELQQQQQQLRSNLVSQPQYSTATAADTTSLRSPTTSPKSFRYPAKIQFVGKDTVACINCSTMLLQQTTTTTTSTAGADTAVSDEMDRTGTTYLNYSRKLGPVLLELRNIALHKNDNDDATIQGDSVFSMEQTICRSRGNPSLGTSVSSTCLDVCRTNTQLSSSSTTLLCATGLSTGALCIHSFPLQNDDTTNIISVNSPSQLQYYSSLRQHRPATAVAWRPNNPAHVAIGLQSSNSSNATSSISHNNNNNIGNSGNSNINNANITTGSTSTAAMSSSTSSGRGGIHAAMVGGSHQHHHAPHQHHFTSRGGGGPNTAGATGAEYCCFVWDIEHQQPQQQPQQQHKKSVPLYKLSHQVPVSCLAWLRQMDHSSSTSGGGGDVLAIGSRTLQLYDLRSSSGGRNPVASTPPASVFAHSTGVQGMAVASSSSSSSWQLATWAINEPVKIWDVRRLDAGAVSEIKVTTPVQAAEWSESGVLVVVSGSAAFEYDVTGGRPVLVNTVYAKEPIVDFALYPYGVDSSFSDSNNIVQEWFPYRMAVVHADRTVHDLARVRNAPIALSSRDGRIAHSFGRTLWMGSTASGPTAMEGLQRSKEEDISANMMRRARCLHVSKYSMDSESNIKMLFEDAQSIDLGPTKVALLRLWHWIERVEDLCSSEGEEPWEDGNVNYWPAKGLLDAGVWLLLGMESNDYEAESSTVSEELCCTTYDSATRRAALASCGWASKFDLFNILGECEDLGEFERSAALAVWHGNLGAAVEALQRGADHVRREATTNEKTPSNDALLSVQYAETMERISLCIAGFRGGDAESASSRVWRKACANLLTRLQTNDSQTHGNRVGYIRCVLKFLMKIGYGGYYEEVLGDLSVSLCDRIGFACRFLPRNDLKVFLRSCIDDCQLTGNVEGVAITGMDKEGVKILQSYVDMYADVQTAALVTSRVIFPPAWGEERRIAAEWLHAYRSLLNTWQMWQSRAMFDVDRAELLRKVKAKQAEAQSGALARTASLAKPKIQPVRRAAMRQPDPEVQASVPAQLDARCNYCSSPLGLKKKDSNPNAWLAKMNPIVSCCPQCRKPLPRCAICMLSLGTLNPYIEYTKTKDQSSANLPFAEWFTWCLRCKHGGHAHHMVGWFANQEVCPVSGCDCRCQFDGVNKLSRPALSSSTISPANDVAES